MSLPIVLVVVLIFVGFLAGFLELDEWAFWALLLAAVLLIVLLVG